MRKRIRKIALKSNAFNRKLLRESYFFVVDAAEETITIGILSQDSEKLRKQIEEYMNMIGIELKDVCLEEITFRAFSQMLQQASIHNYILSNDEVLENFGLEDLNHWYGRNRNFDEGLIEDCPRSAAYATAEQLFSNETLLPELNRIYAAKQKNHAFGHPVHYMIETDDSDTREKMCRLLLQSLYANQRLRNRRYCYLEFKPGENLSRMYYDRLYKSCSGGTVIVRYIPGDDTENDMAASGRETVELLCETMIKYRHQVLTVFCLPRDATASKALFYANLCTASFVELKEDLMSNERATQFLNLLAINYKIPADQALLTAPEPDKCYLAPELRNLFENWYSHKLKTTVYPQYLETVTVSAQVAEMKPRGSAYEELMMMIGLDAAKKMIHQILNYYKAQKLFADRGMKMDRPAMHMSFTGRPGTAKTTVARLFSRIMKENDLLSKGNLIEVGRGDLVGKYVGWTAPLIQKKFKEAAGGVLFIDEAYSLVDDRDGSFGDEAINTIVQEMENHRNDVIVVFAGYPDQMEKFLQKNPGLRSRIAFHIPFADYSSHELCRIADLLARKKGLKLTAEAQSKLLDVFEAAKSESDFGNGRYVRNVIEKAQLFQASRLLDKDPAQITSEDIATLCAEDIEMPTVFREIRQKIGFIA